MSEQEHLLGADEIEAIIRQVVERLAPIDRTPCSAGEREAAEWLRERLIAVEGVDVVLEDEPSWGTFAPTATGLGILGTLASLLTLRGRRRAGGMLAALVFAGILDEAHNGPRILRRLVRRRKVTVNVVARLGRRVGPPDGAAGMDGGGGHAVGAAGLDGGGGAAVGAAARDGAPVAAGVAGPATIDTVVVIAHHDAPQTSFMFDQTAQRWVYEHAPQVIERFRTPAPQWWLGLSPAALTVLGALTGRRRLAQMALPIGAFVTAGVADIWRTDTTPGANDNLSGVAVLVALAEMLRARPLPGLRVLLVSCGAEETLQDGIRAFMSSHSGEFDPARTCFLNVDTVGSPHLVLLEAEGPVKMEYYAGPWIRDLLEQSAERAGIELLRGYRARASTDSVIPSRAGYATGTLVSITDWRMPANYHLPTDTPENLDYGSVRNCALLLYETMGALGIGAG